MVGTRIAASTPMIAITTINSISVKPFAFVVFIRKTSSIRSIFEPLLTVPSLQSAECAADVFAVPLFSMVLVYHVSKRMSIDFSILDEVLIKFDTIGFWMLFLSTIFAVLHNALSEFAQIAH